MKKKDPLLVMLCSFTVLALLYWGVNALIARRAEAEAAEEAQSLSIIGLDAARLISLESPDASALSFSYDEETGWTSPLYEGWPLVQNEVETLEHSLIEISAVRALEEHGELSEYGLDEPNYTLTLDDGEGTVYELLIGGEDANGNYYACLTGDERVFTLSSSLPDTLDTDIFDFVEYESLPLLSEDDVTAISLEYSGSLYEYT
ncbi:MAG: DUF4340 domain-containing protein, partial [Oscillospiraceae bacterium]|nr:DUF4340 domain-containing protein [Oscillospiraceae bacterium]